MIAGSELKTNDNHLKASTSTRLLLPYDCLLVFGTMLQWNNQSFNVFLGAINVNQNFELHRQRHS